MPVFDGYQDLIDKVRLFLHNGGLWGEVAESSQTQAGGAHLGTLGTPVSRPVLNGGIAAAGSAVHPDVQGRKSHEGWCIGLRI